MPGRLRPASLPPRPSSGSAPASTHRSCHRQQSPEDMPPSAAIVRARHGCSTGGSLDPTMDPVEQLGNVVGKAASTAASQASNLCSAYTIPGKGGLVSQIWRASARSCRGAVFALSELACDVRQSSDEILPYLAELAVQVLTERPTCPLAERLAGRPLQEIMPLMMVAMMMGAIYFAFVVCAAPSATITFFTPGASIFHFAFLMAMASYHQGVATDPGRIPDTWREGVGVLERIRGCVTEKKKQTGEVRFCRKEQKYKPDRSHFCAPLQYNVLRMDHYCPWMSNCIGHFNYKFFVLFLFYTTVAVNIALFGLIQSLQSQLLSAGSTVLMVEATLLSALLSSTLTPFFALHCWLLTRNMTTIEFCEKRGWERGSKCVSHYDVGVYENMRSVLGESIWLWLLPIGGPLGDGLSFQTRESSEVMY